MHGILTIGVFARGTWFADARNNGTPVQTNDTRMGSGAVGMDAQLGSAGSLALRGYIDTESYNQNFSAIAASRMTEALTNIQHVPAQDEGASAQWTRALGKSQTLLAGVDFRESIGASEEQIISSGTHTFTNVSGGCQPGSRVLRRGYSSPVFEMDGHCRRSG